MAFVSKTSVDDASTAKFAHVATDFSAKLSGKMPESRSIAVIGGGATGLAAAHDLAKAGAKVRLFECNTHLGGAVRSERDGEWLIESGPNSLQESAELGALIAELGLGNERCYAQPEAKNRYILRDGRPVAAPASPPGLFQSKLFSFGAKVRLFAEILKRPRIRPADISLAQFIRSHFGDELVDYGLNPFVSGVYAGDPEKLSAKYAFPSLWKMERETGSIIRGQIKAAKAKRARGQKAGPPAIISFREGLGTIPAALARELPEGAIETNARVTTLVRGETGWTLVWARDGSTSSETFDRVVIALPALPLSQLAIGPLGERPLAELANIVSPPVASLFLGYRREQVTHPLDGFGILMPQKENRQVLGVLFSSSLFPGRAPDGHVAVTVMMGGVRRMDLGRADEDQLLAIARRELGEILGVSGDPVFHRLNRWPRAIPQYDLGYGAYLKAIEACERTHAGLYIGGQVRDGIAVPSCLSAGAKLAERALG
ncbi:protoporphyrinogen oxidase [Actomonas aquatica]|uniref:Coproporphyrinogen III oxidase n=1 Tax=Actomonas aquatica TaxID=2866162 RepID=A0ABZ1CB32_9BACT|nr:protoporphyrinogen oxidase [Opitutus sp. WL0086]WRQ88855.1 protoporphyrinogen oxidase [Opitutus sp. WL0086]